MKKIFAIICVLAVLCTTLTAYASAPTTKASSLILATLNGQQIVYSKNPDEKLPPADFTKLMTAYTAYKIYGMDATIKIPSSLSEYTNSLETGMKLKGDEEILCSDLLYGMILGQANDAATAIALYFGGIEEFVARMNTDAIKLGMKNTAFTNPTGNNDEKQYTTANDILILFKAFYNNKDLYPLISKKNHTIPATNLSEERTYWTKNHLMSRFIYLDYIYEYAKAGTSSVSSHGGYSVISSAAKGTKELVCIVLNSAYENGVNYSMIDAVDMFNYGFDSFSTVTVAKQGDLLYEAKLKNQRGKDTLLLAAAKTVKGLILDDDSIESVKKEVVIDEPVSASIKKGDVVGKVIYKYRDNIMGEVDLLAERDVKRSIIRTIISGIKWFFGLKAIKLILLAIACIIAVFIALIINASKPRNKNKRKHINKYNSVYKNRRY